MISRDRFFWIDTGGIDTGGLLVADILVAARLDAHDRCPHHAALLLLQLGFL